MNEKIKLILIQYRNMKRFWLNLKMMIKFRKAIFFYYREDLLQGRYNYFVTFSNYPVKWKFNIIIYEIKKIENKTSNLL